MADINLDDDYINSMIEEASQGYDFSNYFTGGGPEFDFGQLDPNAFSFDDLDSLLSGVNLGGLDPNAFSLDDIDKMIEEASFGTDFSNYFKGGGEEFNFGALDPNAIAFDDIDALIAEASGANRGYYDEITGEFIRDPNGPLQGPLDERSGTNIESMAGYTYDPKTGTWTTPSGETYTPKTPPSGAVRSGAQVMVNAGALPAGYAGLKPEKGSTAGTMGGKPGWESSKTPGGTKTGTQQKSGLEALLPLLLMLLAMNKDKGGGGSSAVIPALTATQRQTPYTQTQQAPGYRPGQGGITYFNPVQYSPRMASGGGIASLDRGRLLDGPGDGVSDSIPAMIGGMASGGQPARLARGEYVIDARTVAALGNGSTDAGAERLDEMRKKVLATDRKAKVGADSKAYKHLKV